VAWCFIVVCALQAGCGGDDGGGSVLDGAAPPAQNGASPDAAIGRGDGGPVAADDAARSPTDGAPDAGVSRSDGAPMGDASRPARDAGAAGDPDAARDAGGGACVPARAAWDGDIAPLLTSRCGTCHGQPPQFGAPVTLLDYARLVAGDPGQRLVDLLIQKVESGAMPPPGQTRLTVGEARHLLDWATCGHAPADPVPGGFDVSAPILGAPANPPAGTEFFDLLVPGYDVPLANDHYECFVFQVPIQADRFIRRIDAIVDQTAVVHHFVLMRGDQGHEPGTHFGCGALIDPVYAWAPGTGPLQFPDGGIRVSPGQRFTVQIHYNNRQRLGGLQDHSGLRIYHAPPVGTEVGMTALGPTDIYVEPRSQAQATGVCDIRHPLHIVASWPHMHEQGYAFESWVEHPDGSRTDIVTLRGWDFHSQFLYDTPLDLNPGDRIYTRCTWRNRQDQAVRFGEGTQDEMCFDFLYHTPPMDTPYCDRDPNSPPPDEPPPPPPVGDYSPGACAPPVDPAAVPEAHVAVAEGQPPAPAGDIPADGTWIITGGTLYLPTFRLPIGAVDPAATQLAGHGVIAFDGAGLALDFDAVAHLVLTDGRVFDVALPITLSGPQAAGGPGELVVHPDCGLRDETHLFVGLDGDVLHVTYVDRRAGFPIWLALDLHRL
jgi:hypothetical protein